MLECALLPLAALIKVKDMLECALLPLAALVKVKDMLECALLPLAVLVKERICLSVPCCHSLSLLKKRICLSVPCCHLLSLLKKSVPWCRLLPLFMMEPVYARENCCLTRAQGKFWEWSEKVAPWWWFSRSDHIIAEGVVLTVPRETFGNFNFRFWFWFYFNLIMARRCLLQRRHRWITVVLRVCQGF